MTTCHVIAQLNGLIYFGFIDSLSYSCTFSKPLLFIWGKMLTLLNWAPMKSKLELVKLGLAYLSLVSSMLVCIDQDLPRAFRILFTHQGHFKANLQGAFLGRSQRWSSSYSRLTLWVTGQGKTNDCGGQLWDWSHTTIWFRHGLAYYTTLQFYYTTLGLVAHYIHGAWFTIELYTLHHLYMVWYGLLY